jgi:hypothetical protein
MKSTQGSLSPDVALIDTPVTLVLMDGNVDLQKEQLNLRFVARPKNASPFTARSPILVTGTLADPHVKPKVAPIAARVLGGIALAFVNPLAAIIPFIDPGTGKHSACSDALSTFNTSRARNAKAAKPDTTAPGTEPSGDGIEQQLQLEPPARQPVPETSSVKPSKSEPAQDKRPSSPGTRGIPGHGVE